MRLPPPSIVRPGPPPDDLLLVVRGGRDSLSDALLERTTADTWDQFQFFGVSVFGAVDDDLTRLGRTQPAIRRRAVLRVARVGVLRAGGFEVVPTFGDPTHYSVVLPDVTAAAFAGLRACFSDPVPNPAYEPDR